jgi:hypothetical protein
MKLLVLTMTLMLSMSVFACGGDKMDNDDGGKKKKQTKVSN